MPGKYTYRTTFTFDGKRYEIRANSERELIEKKTEKFRDLREGKIVIGPNMTVRAWAEQALATYKANVSKTPQALILQGFAGFPFFRA